MSTTMWTRSSNSLHRFWFILVSIIAILLDILSNIQWFTVYIYKCSFFPVFFPTFSPITYSVYPRLFRSIFLWFVSAINGFVCSSWESGIKWGHERYWDTCVLFVFDYLFEFFSDWNVCVRLYDHAHGDVKDNGAFF